MATVSERVTQVIVDQLGVEAERVTPESAFVDDLNADSLDMVELVMALEEEFGKDKQDIEIPDEHAEKIITVQDAISYLRDEHGIEDA